MLIYRQGPCNAAVQLFFQIGIFQLNVKAGSKIVYSWILTALSHEKVQEIGKVECSPGVNLITVLTPCKS